MSAPTYRIDVRPAPPSKFGWHYADVYRLSDDSFVVSLIEENAEAALALARQWVWDENHKPAVTESIYVDDEGQPVEGHSVKA